MIADSDAAVRFLQVAFEPTDWVALLLKSYATGDVVQRVGPLSRLIQPSLHRWLRAMNARGYNVYVSVNALAEGARNRTKTSIASVRHVFVEADGDGAAILKSIDVADDLPSPSYALTSSPDHVHVFWRAESFDNVMVERLQKHLAARLGTDTAATSCSQTTRLPGYRNRKYAVSPLVTVEYRDVFRRFTPETFPAAPVLSPKIPPPFRDRGAIVTASERARRYLARVEPAVAGQHGDLHTFRVCCRIVRGFGLTDAEAAAVLDDWNNRCDPPWTDRELQDKIASARRYGREPIGALL